MFFRAHPAALAVVLACWLSTSAADPTPVIVITPGALEQPRTSAITAVTIIDAETIQNSNAGSVVELLRGHAGLHIRDLFGDGREATVDLRGFGPAATSNTLILVDGQRLNNSADQAAPDLSSLELDRIERIEIMQGSAGVLYGHQAVGGVVNIIRRRITDNRVRVGVRAGSFNSRRLSAGMDRVAGATRLSLTASDQRSDNFRDHNDSEQQRLQLSAVRQHAGFSARVEFDASDEHILTPGALLADEVAIDRSQSLPIYQQDFFDTEARSLRLGFERYLDQERRVSVDLSRRDTDREFIQSFREFAGSLNTQGRDTRQWNARYVVQPEGERSLSSLVLGIGHEQTDYELLSILGPQRIDQDIAELFLSSQWRIGERGRIDGGLRYTDQDAVVDVNRFDDSVTVFSLGYSHSLNGWRWFWRADQNFRFPTVEEHTNVPLGQPPGLRTQQGISYELGAEFIGSGKHLRVTLYRIELDDEIGFDASGFANLNLDETRRQGLVVEGSWQLSNKVSAGFSLTRLDAEISGGPFTGRQLPSVPERSLRLDASYRPNDRWLLGAELLAVGEQMFGGDFSNELGPMPSGRVVNANLSYRRGQWALKLRSNNLFDEVYSEAGSLFTRFDPVTFEPTSLQAFFPSPGRNTWLSADYEF